MPPFRGSKNAHEHVDGVHEEAEEALTRIITEKDKHEKVNLTARNLLRDHGRYSDQTSVIATPWVYNPDLEDKTTRTAYQLRSSNAIPREGEDFGEIDLIVRVSRPNPINPNALITYEEVRARMNCPVVFVAGEIESGTHTNSLGIGVADVRSRHESTINQSPIRTALDSENLTFTDNVDTLSLMEDSLH